MLTSRGISFVFQLVLLYYKFLLFLTSINGVPSLWSGVTLAMKSALYFLRRWVPFLLLSCFFDSGHHSFYVMVINELLVCVFPALLSCRKKPPAPNSECVLLASENWFMHLWLCSFQWV